VITITITKIIYSRLRLYLPFRLLTLQQTQNLLTGFLLVLLGLVAPVAQSASVVATVSDGLGQPVKDAVISLTSADTRAGGLLGDLIVDQIDKEFVPHVKPVELGSAVNFPNKDNIRHHVYSFSPAKTFELPLYEGTPAKPQIFDKRGVIVLGCNIHDWMRGYIYVVDTPYAATTDGAGRAEINELPAGSYQMDIWHPQAAAYRPSTLTLVLDKTASEAVSFKVDLKPAIKIRRTPAGRNRGGY
jgi:plastocyanin